MSAKKQAAQQKTRTRNVRVVPYNERAGYLAQNITWRGRKFTNQWTEVPASIAAQLKAIDQPGRPGIRLFDVMTESQILKLEADARDAELTKLVSKNRLRENELRVVKERRDPRTDFDDPEEDPADDDDTDAEDETDFEPNPDPDGSRADTEREAEESGDKDWSEWEGDLNGKNEEPVEGPPIPAKRKSVTKKKKVAKKTNKTRGGRAKKKT